MDDEFLATTYPKVHGNLKLITDKRVIEDNLESHFGSMSSMKNLEDTDNFRDQFLYDKPTEDDQEKSKVVNESDSTIPDPSHQTIPLTPLVISPVIDFSSHKPSSLLRVARLEQEMSEVKKTDHSAVVLASVKLTESETEPQLLLKMDKETDPEKAHEALAGPDPCSPIRGRPGWIYLEKYMLSLAGPNPEPHDDEMHSLQPPKVMKNLKLHKTDERVIEEIQKSFWLLCLP
ncbi:hypothetical protein Tco_1107488 [Tanacetum coccineum]